jgi:hypothetical protein
MTDTADMAGASASALLPQQFSEPLDFLPSAAAKFSEKMGI